MDHRDRKGVGIVQNIISFSLLNGKRILPHHQDRFDDARRDPDEGKDSFWVFYRHRCYSFTLQRLVYDARSPTMLPFAVGDILSFQLNEEYRHLVQYVLHQINTQRLNFTMAARLNINEIDDLGNTDTHTNCCNEGSDFENESEVGCD